MGLFPRHERASNVRRKVLNFNEEIILSQRGAFSGAQCYRDGQTLALTQKRAIFNRTSFFGATRLQNWFPKIRSLGMTRMHNAGFYNSCLFGGSSGPWVFARRGFFSGLKDVFIRVISFLCGSFELYRLEFIIYVRIVLFKLQIVAEKLYF